MRKSLVYVLFTSRMRNKERKCEINPFSNHGEIGFTLIGFARSFLRKVFIIYFIIIKIYINTLYNERETMKRKIKIIISRIIFKII